MKRYWEWERPFGWTPESTALVIIDMQCGFLNEESPVSVPMARAQVPAIRQVLDDFRNRELPIIFTRFVVKPDHFYPFYRTISRQRGIDAISQDAPFSIGGADAAIIPELSPRPGEIVVDKVAYDGFAETSLEGLLRSRGVKTLVIAGTVVNWCVDSTLRSAFHRRFNSIVLADAVSGYDHAGATANEWVDHELDQFAEAFAIVMESGELIAALDDQPAREPGVCGRPPRGSDKPSELVDSDIGGK